MSISCVIRVIIGTIFIETLLCAPLQSLNAEYSPNVDDAENIRLALAKALWRHPLGILLGHVIIQTMDKANENEIGNRDRRYQGSPLNDQSFLRFGRNHKHDSSKRPADSYDINDTSFLRFGRSGI